MNHREARLALADLVAGDLHPDARKALEGHLKACPECPGWLETYRFLRAGLGSDLSQKAGNHLPSDLLASWAVSRIQLPRARQREVVTHLRRCQGCRQEAQWAADAVRSGRGPERIAFWRPRLGPQRRFAPRHAILLAASLAAALLVLIQLPSPWSTSEGRPQAVVAEARQSGETELQDQELDGLHLIEGGESLRLQEVRIQDGAVVTFRAEKRFALGDGVTIGSGTRVVFEVADGTAGVEGALEPRAREGA